MVKELMITDELFIPYLQSTPERNFIASVLQTAIHDVQLPKLDNQASHSFTSPLSSEGQGYLSFVTCCDLLDLDPNHVLRYIDLSPPKAVTISKIARELGEDIN